MLCSCVRNNLLSFFFLICVFYAWPLFVHLSVFTSRSCSSPSLCWFLQIFDQTLTASSVRQTMQRPKVCSHHAWPILLSFFLFRPCTHTHSSQPHLCLSVPSRSLQSMDDARDIPPPPPPSLPLPLLCVTRGFEALRNLTEKIRPWTDLPKADVPFSRHQDHRHKDLHWFILTRKTWRRGASLDASAAPNRVV